MPFYLPLFDPRNKSFRISINWEKYRWRICGQCSDVVDNASVKQIFFYRLTSLHFFRFIRMFGTLDGMAAWNDVLKYIRKWLCCICLCYAIHIHTHQLTQAWCDVKRCALDVNVYVEFGVPFHRWHHIEIAFAFDSWIRRETKIHSIFFSIVVSIDSSYKWKIRY